jgi:hypothetical protein
LTGPTSIAADNDSTSIEQQQTQHATSTPNLIMSSLLNANANETSRNLFGKKSGNNPTVNMKENKTTFPLQQLEGKENHPESNVNCTSNSATNTKETAALSSSSKDNTKKSTANSAGTSDTKKKLVLSTSSETKMNGVEDKEMKIIYFGKGAINKSYATSEMHTTIRKHLDDYEEVPSHCKRAYAEKLYDDLFRGRNIEFRKLPKNKGGDTTVMVHEDVVEGIYQILHNKKNNDKRQKAKGRQSFRPQDVIIGRGKSGDGTHEGTFRYGRLIRDKTNEYKEANPNQRDAIATDIFRVLTKEGREFVDAKTHKVLDKKKAMEKIKKSLADRAKPSAGGKTLDRATKRQKKLSDMVVSI